MSSSQTALVPHGLGSQGFDGGEQETNGFPVYPGGHLHFGLCLATSHKALDPHLQGELHLPLIHASFESHSELLLHP